MPERTRLAEAIATRWTHIEPFLPILITNARTEGHNRVIKQLKRAADSSYPNHANQEGRIVLHIVGKKAA